MSIGETMNAKLILNRLTGDYVQWGIGAFMLQLTKYWSIINCLSYSDGPQKKRYYFIYLSNHPSTNPSIARTRRRKRLLQPTNPDEISTGILERNTNFLANARYLSHSYASYPRVWRGWCQQLDQGWKWSWEWNDRRKFQGQNGWGKVVDYLKGEGMSASPKTPKHTSDYTTGPRLVSHTKVTCHKVLKTWISAHMLGD